MQENILEANPEADLEVYVAWEPMLGASRRDAVQATRLLPDPRVQHFWNDAFIVGDRFREHDSGRTAWDIYFLYGPEASWDEMPDPLIISGRTVIRKRQALEAELAALWGENRSTGE